MPYMQRIQLMGVTGQAAEFKVLPSGPLANFSVCVEEFWRDQQTGERKNLKTWFRCSAFGRIAEQAAKALPSGTWVFLEGRMRMRRVDDKDYWGVTVDNFRRLSKPDRPEPEDEVQEHPSD